MSERKKVIFDFFVGLGETIVFGERSLLWHRSLLLIFSMAALLTTGLLPVPTIPSVPQLPLGNPFPAILVLSGALGGLINTLLVDGGFTKGFTATLPTGKKVRRPGWLGSVFVGTLATLAVWPLYGATGPSADFQELYRQIGAAIVAGFSGARIITAEVDKILLNAATDDLHRVGLN